MPDVTPTITSAALRQKWSRFKIVIALDPGLTTGVAIYYVDADELECRTLSFWATTTLAIEFDPSKTAVLIEDPRFNRPTFDHGEQGRRKREKISQNVGQNKQDAARLVQLFEGRRFEAIAVRPRPVAGTKKGKWDAKTCRQLTGYDRTPNNQHVRDAIKLLYQEGVI